jgi:hypothetical protein
MVTSVSPAHEGRTISSSPDTTTKNGTTLSPCSSSTSPGCIARICPCTAMRLSCVGVNFGNICSTRELVRGSPLDVLLIDVLSSAVAPQKLFGSFSRSICGIAIAAITTDFRISALLYHANEPYMLNILTDIARKIWSQSVKIADRNSSHHRSISVFSRYIYRLISIVGANQIR